jgi:hypothetical protein
MFSDIGFHTEFSTQWQKFEFDDEESKLVVSGTDAEGSRYRMTVYLEGAEAQRGA